MLVSLDPQARNALGPLRAQEWAKEISPDEFCERNDRLYAHPFGSRIRTFGWREGGKLVASLDLLGLSAIHSGSSDVEPAGLIASVVTEHESRGKGFGSKLLSAVVDAHSEHFLVLHSEVDPRFYERFGFQRADVGSVEGRAGASAPSYSSISMQTFLEELGRVRRRTAVGAIAIHPDPEFWDWQQVRLRYFAELRSQPYPAEATFRVTHDGGTHLLAASPNAVAGFVEGLWVEPNCDLCRQVLGDLCRGWGIDRWRFWGAPTDGRERLHPMFRAPSGGRWEDVQLGEWW